MRKYFVKASATLLMTLSLLGGVSSARDISHIELAMNQSQPQGTGRLNFWGFHIYDATLYSAGNSSSSDFALNIQYQKSFSGSAIASKTADEMKKIGVPEMQAAIWGKELAAVFPNIEPGQSITGIYSPKVGTTFFFEGKKIAQIPGAEFSKAFFGIWLDPKTSAPKLRAELLGNGCPPPLISGVC
jgi:hypothetical protein